MIKENFGELKIEGEVVDNPDKAIDESKLEIFRTQLKEAAPELNDRARDIIESAAKEHLDILFENKDAYDTFIKEVVSFLTESSLDLSQSEKVKESISEIIDAIKNNFKKAA